MEEFKEFHELCIGCRKCTVVCPGLIDIPGLVEQLRTRMVEQRGLPFAVRRMFDIVTNRRLFHSLLRTASKLQKPLQSGPLIRRLPLFYSSATKGRSLPVIADTPLRDRIARRSKTVESPKYKIGFFSGCTIDFVFPETGENVINVLENLDMEVLFPTGQGCCGKPVRALGDLEYTKELAKRNIAAFDEIAPDLIVCACPTGVEQFRDYAEILAGEPEWAERARAFASKIREFSSFVHSEYMKRGIPEKYSSGSEKLQVTYHDSCHLKRVLDVYREPRELITAFGYELTEMTGADACCGMSGVFGVKYPGLSIPIVSRKILRIGETKAPVVACACPGCMVQLQGGLDQRLPGTKMMHIADLLANKTR